MSGINNVGSKYCQEHFGYAFLLSWEVRKEFDKEFPELERNLNTRDSSEPQRQSSPNCPRKPGPGREKGVRKEFDKEIQELERIFFFWVVLVFFYDAERSEPGRKKRVRKEFDKEIQELASKEFRFGGCFCFVLLF